MMEKIIPILFVFSLWAKADTNPRRFLPSPAGFCLAALGSEKFQFTNPSLARQSTQDAYLIFRSFRRDHLKVERNDQWRSDFFHKTVFTSDASSDYGQRQAALR